MGGDGRGLWAVHVISPSCYDDGRFNRLLDRFRACGLGLIVCPTGALSMRQDPAGLDRAPVHNSIARVEAFIDKGIPVRMGSDNIEDNFLPNVTADLYNEVFVLSNAIRFYDIDILARLAAGRLNATSNMPGHPRTANTAKAWPANLPPVALLAHKRISPRWWVRQVLTSIDFFPVSIIDAHGSRMVMAFI